MYKETNHKYKDYISYWLLLMFFLVATMIVIGGLTRLTDSGLSITEWELFKGLIPPLNTVSWEIYFETYKNTTEFKLQNFSMSLEEFKIIFLWEWAHRFFGRLIGLVFFFPLIYFTFKVGLRKTNRYYIIFLLICFQGFLGWYMVQSGLINNVDVSHFRLSIHLLFAFIILSLIYWNYLSLKNNMVLNRKLKKYLPEIFLVLIFLQIIVGAFVAGMDAGKIYNSWPLMGDNFFPDDNRFRSLFRISALSDPSLVQFIHRNLAYIILIIYSLMYFLIYKNKINQLFKSINILGFIIILQVILGILTIITGANIILASLHQFSSILLVASTLNFLFKNRFN